MDKLISGIIGFDSLAGALDYPIDDAAIQRILLQHA